MSLKCGIVGLPNVGKSTLFNALTKAGIAAENYPFCTIEPNVGIVEVPDPRLAQLAEIVKPQRIQPAIVEFVDIAGLVRGAHKGEGLGNQFLAHVREVAAIAHVVRCFDDPNVVHVAGRVDPASDIETIDTELMLADLAALERRQERLRRSAKGDPDEPALLVFNQVLGGMFSSRLNLNLREAKGWTYGAWSAVDPRAGVGPFQAGAGVKTEHTADALAEVFKEFDALKSEGVRGDAELNAAKANYVKSLPGRFETLGDLASAASSLFMYELPMDYYATLPDRISAVTADDVKRVAERALVKDDMAIILVGDKAAIEEGVNGLGLGELLVVDPYGQPIKN